MPMHRNGFWIWGEGRGGGRGGGGGGIDFCTANVSVAKNKSAKVSSSYTSSYVIM